MFPALYTVAPLAELVDARDSKSRSREGVPVRFRRGAPLFFIFISTSPRHRPGSSGAKYIEAFSEPMDRTGFRPSSE